MWFLKINRHYALIVLVILFVLFSTLLPVYARFANTNDPSLIGNIGGDNKNRDYEVDIVLPVHAGVFDGWIGYHQGQESTEDVIDSETKLLHIEGGAATKWFGVYGYGEYESDMMKGIDSQRRYGYYVQFPVMTQYGIRTETGLGNFVQDKQLAATLGHDINEYEAVSFNWRAHIHSTWEKDRLEFGILSELMPEVSFDHLELRVTPSAEFHLGNVGNLGDISLNGKVVANYTSNADTYGVDNWQIQWTGGLGMSW